MELIDTPVCSDEPFFAPAPSDLIDSLIGQYRFARQKVEACAATVGSFLDGGTIDYFLSGNASEDRGRHSMSRSAAQLFDLSGALRALNSAYWSKALALTDVLDLMPQKRRNEWHESITAMSVPDFEETTVRNTLMELLNMRAMFLGERVDGIFRGLSGEHVTNAPQAFGKRMIIARLLSSYGTIDHDPAGLINDLRCIIAKFTGRDEPGYKSSSVFMNSLKGRWGEWVAVDGGALKVRLYKKGTAHLEVHPDIAWRLNQILAALHPLAIPAQFRERPKSRVKDVPLLKRPLPFRVLDLLAGAEPTYERQPGAWPERYTRNRQERQFSFTDREKAGPDALREAQAVLEAIGGVLSSKGHFTFDYDPEEAIESIINSGCIPDDRAHQFYPTPQALAARLVELADIGNSHTVLEPSAGTGSLAALLPTDRTTCVEVAELRAAVLRAKGYTTHHAEFLDWSADAMCRGSRFDRVVMNPPFANGRALSHLIAASTIVAPGGTLVAILPSGLRNSTHLRGWACEWSPVLSNQFPGVSIDVVLLKATLPAA